MKEELFVTILAGVITYQTVAPLDDRHGHHDHAPEEPYPLVIDHFDTPFVSGIIS